MALSACRSLKAASFRSLVFDFCLYMWHKQRGEDGILGARLEERWQWLWCSLLAWTEGGNGSGSRTTWGISLIDMLHRQAPVLQARSLTHNAFLAMALDWIMGYRRSVASSVEHHDGAGGRLRFLFWLSARTPKKLFVISFLVFFQQSFQDICPINVSVVDSASVCNCTLFIGKYKCVVSLRKTMTLGRGGPI